MGDSSSSSRSGSSSSCSSSSCSRSGSSTMPLGLHLTKSLLCSSRCVSYSVSRYNSSTRVGVVGMGHVGTAVTNNLLRNGFTVSGVMDVKAELCQGYPDNVKVVSTPREVADISDVVVTGLPKPPHVREMFYGTDGLLAGMGPGKVWIDHSTTDHEQNKEFTADLTKEAYLNVKPILDASYNSVMYTGALGT